MKASIPIALPPNLRILRIEREAFEHWKLWLHTRDFKLGTFILLHDDGLITQHTIREDGTEEIITIKEGDAT